MTTIPRQYVDDVCKIGQGAACCCMLVVGGDGFECARNTPLELVILARRESMSAQSLNCEGYGLDKSGSDGA